MSHDTALLLLLLASYPLTEAAAAAAAPPLPRLSVSTITVSGLSSGADFAVQFHVAFSDIVVGSACFAGQAYMCAVHKFSSEAQLTCASAPDGPGCTGYTDRSPCIGCVGPNSTVQYDHCKKNPEAVEIRTLALTATAAAARGAIAPLSGLARQRAYFYRGTKDSVYGPGSVNKTRDFFAAFMNDPSSQLLFEAGIPAQHAQPTADPWVVSATCGNGSVPGAAPGLANCGYDGIGTALQHIYENTLVTPTSLVESDADPALSTFNQTLYFPVGRVDPGLGDTGYIYTPPACAGGAAPCKLHFAFHGCGQESYIPNVNTTFVVHSGYLAWAAANNIIVIFPQGGGYAERGQGSLAPSGQIRGGCWDGYGQVGVDYAWRTGPQPATIRSMIRSLAGR